MPGLRYLRVGDGGVQQVVATGDVAVRATMLIDMDGATDHPSLLVTLASGAVSRRRVASGAGGCPM